MVPRSCFLRRSSLVVASIMMMMLRSCRSFTIPTLSRRTTATTPFRLSSTSSSRLSSTTFDVIVVGGGHAGCEAAAAAARTGARTALVTQRLDTIGELSCNPSIGGIGKGHLVREIDALQGLMGTVADQAGIHYRLLNRRKGPAVRGPRAQMDRDLYKEHMQELLLAYPNLTCIQASVEDLLLDEKSTLRFSSVQLQVPPSSSTTLFNGSTGTTAQEPQKARIQGVLVEDTDTKTKYELYSPTVVITTGTFLRGVLMLGHDRYAGGRHLRDSEAVEPPSTGLAQTLARFQFPLGRLKTGTPARIDGKTIDWTQCTIQPTENPVSAFSHVLQFRQEQPICIATGRTIDCYQTATNAKTHALVMKYEHTLPLYDGGLDGAGNGPRYCPSIYKKVQRFPDREGHNCFLEPEGLNTDLVYPNGMSGPYPQDIQQEILRTLPGLQNVDIVRPGYDVEYDFVNPIALTHTLETKTIGGLYLAGQICGTTGYEEAAAQGIIAGCNAGRAATLSNPVAPFIIGRDEGYIGVLIDDLVTRGTSEPYRMFTSRAEYRITLRADNADLRLTRKGMEFGLVHDEERIAAVETRDMMVNDQIEQLRSFQLKVSEWASYNEGMGGAKMSVKEGHKKSAEQILGMPHVTLQEVEDIMVSHGGDGESTTTNNNIRSAPFIHDTVEASVKYQSYARRQHKDMESWRRAQGLKIPPDTVYNHETLPTLSTEELEKLNAVRPTTFAQASQISGMKPHSVVYLYHSIMKKKKQQPPKRAASAAVP